MAIIGDGPRSGMCYRLIRESKKARNFGKLPKLRALQQVEYDIPGETIRFLDYKNCAICLNAEKSGITKACNVF